MSDTAYPTFQHYGTAAERAAFTPSPASGTQPIYIWYETDTGDVYLYNGSGWVLIGGNFLDSAAQGDILYFNGTNWVPLNAGTAGYFLKTQGAGANPVWAAVSGELQVANIDLDDTAIKSLNSSPQTIVAAQGANTKIIVHHVDLISDTNAGGYSASVTLNFYYDGKATALTLAGSSIITTSARDYTSTLNASGSAIAGATLADFFNLGVVLKSSADVTGGNAANTLKGKLYYSVADYN